MLLILILRIASDLAMSVTKSSNESNINGGGGDKVIIEAKIISKKSGTGFYTPEAKLVFAELGQVFSRASISYHIDAKYYIHIETNILGYLIDGILSQLTLKS